MEYPSLQTYQFLESQTAPRFCYHAVSWVTFFVMASDNFTLGIQNDLNFHQHGKPQRSILAMDLWTIRLRRTGELAVDNPAGYPPRPPLPTASTAQSRSLPWKTLRVSHRAAAETCIDKSPKAKHLQRARVTRHRQMLVKPMELSVCGKVRGPDQPLPSFGQHFTNSGTKSKMPEFDRKVLETLREPLESGRIHISRAARHAEFPAEFQLVAAMNPCPCGFHGAQAGKCRCTPDQIARYRCPSAKLSRTFTKDSAKLRRKDKANSSVRIRCIELKNPIH